MREAFPVIAFFVVVAMLPFLVSDAHKTHVKAEEKRTDSVLKLFNEGRLATGIVAKCEPVRTFSEWSGSRERTTIQTDKFGLILYGLHNIPNGTVIGKHGDKAVWGRWTADIEKAF